MPWVKAAPGVVTVARLAAVVASNRLTVIAAVVPTLPLLVILLNPVSGGGRWR